MTEMRVREANHTGDVYAYGPNRCCCCCSKKILSECIFPAHDKRNTQTVLGRRLQVTVRPMLRDRCPVCRRLSVCNVGVLWPNGSMDQDATWYGSRPRPSDKYAKNSAQERYRPERTTTYHQVFKRNRNKFSFKM